jgi:hypothetical protein
VSYDYLSAFFFLTVPAQLPRLNKGEMLLKSLTCIKKVTLKVGPLPKDVQMEEVDDLEEDDFVPVSTFFILFSFSHFLR